MVEVVSPADVIWEKVTVVTAHSHPWDEGSKPKLDNSEEGREIKLESPGSNVLALVYMQVTVPMLQLGYG